MGITPRARILVLFLSIVVVSGMYFLFYDEDISSKYNSKTPCELNDPDFMEIIMVAVNGSGDYKIICREKTEEEKHKPENLEEHIIPENIPIRREIIDFWQNFRGPGNCTANECDAYCSEQENLNECISWCKNNSDLCPDFKLEEWQSKLKQNIIFVPVDVYIIKYNDDDLSSIRNKENINSLFSNVNIIWNQANISANITKIEFLMINDNSIYSSTERLYSYVIQTGNYDKNKINAYFVKTLHGSNGIALPGNVIMIADRTTVFDYRATSHEIGHVLGLKHVGPINRLMARGVNGFDLTDDEIEIAQSNALSKFY
ncbi:MAG: hypothetical protein IH934_00080 [Nanoarchaeota archaeon]|nr:hypothetical protein [Nanoarchaeota archaeon]